MVAAAAFALGIIAADVAIARSGLGALGKVLSVSATVLSAGGLILFARRRRLWSLLVLPMAFVAAGVAARCHADVPAETITPRLALEGSQAVVEGLVVGAPEAEPGRRRLMVDVVGVAKDIGMPLQPAEGRIDATWTLASAPPPPTTPAAVRSGALRAQAGATSASRGDMPGGAPVTRARSTDREGDDSGSGEPPCGEVGDRIRFMARLRAFDPAESPGASSPRAAADRRGVALAAHASVADPCVVLVPAEGGGLEIRVGHLRARVHDAIDRELAPERAALVRAFATGDRSLIAAEVKDDFTTAGLSHLLAVSGLNLTIVAGICLVALAWALRRGPTIIITMGVRWVASIAALPLVFLYTLLVGAAPSAVRSAVMVSALLVAQILRRAPDLWTSVAAAALLMLAAEPLVIGDPSFQLSFAAVIGLLALLPPLRARLAPRLSEWPVWARWPIEVGLASTATMLATAPLVALHFQRISLVGLLANIPAAPISSLVLVPLSLAGGLLAVIATPVGAPFLWAAGHAAHGLRVIAGAFAAVPLAAIPVPPPTALECLAFYGAVGGVLMAPRRARRWLPIACCLVIVAEQSAFALRRRLDRTLRVAVLPVGQGDGIVVELPGGGVILIDTGPATPPPAAERIILPYLHDRHIHAIDRVIITHPHADHLGGLATLARRMRIAEVWWNGDRREAPPEVLAPLSVLPARVVTATLAREQFGDVELELLGPLPAVVATGRPATVNDGSLVVKLTLGRRSVLLTGDAEVAAEEAMLARCAACLRADVLKVGHHGSRTSSSRAFLDAVQPAHAVISAARLNRFGFPSPWVVRRLEDRGARIWRTDLDGAVLIQTDGNDLTVRRGRGARAEAVPARM